MSDPYAYEYGHLRASIQVALARTHDPLAALEQLREDLASSEARLAPPQPTPRGGHAP